MVNRRAVCASRLACLKLLSKLMLASVAVSLFFPVLCSAVSAQEVSVDEVRNKLIDAFEAVAEAERAGGDVSHLVEELDHAVKLLEAGGGEELLEAESKIQDVLEAVSDVKEEGISSTQHRQIMAGIVLFFLAVAAVAVWRFAPRVFWLLWLRSKRRWRAHP
jgi:hypothetical protein